MRHSCHHTNAILTTMKTSLLAAVITLCSLPLMAQNEVDSTTSNQTPPTTVVVKKASAPVQEAPTTVVVQKKTTPSPSNLYDWRSDRHSLSVTVGSPSLISGTTGFFSALFGAFDGYTTRIFGSYGLHYGFNATQWLRVGGSFIYSGWSSEKQTDSGSFLERNDEFNIMAKVDFTYLNRRYVRLYSGLGAGACMSLQRKFTNGQPTPEEEGGRSLIPYPSWTITPIGIEAGGTHVYGLAELNIGFAEFARVGLGVRL